MSLTLDQAQTIVAAALQEARRTGLKPLVVTVLDARGAPKALAAEEGTSLRRADIAHGKAYGALVPVPGGVLLRDDEGTLLGAVGISGDTSDNDEAAALAGIAAAGLLGEPG